MYKIIQPVKRCRGQIFRYQNFRCHIFRYLSLLVCFLLSICGCSLPADNSIAILLPELPEHLEKCAGSITFCLKIPGYSNNKFCGIKPGEYAVVSVSEPVVPVLAYPSAGAEAGDGTGDGAGAGAAGGAEAGAKDGAAAGPPFCAGGIYPADLEGRVLKLTWENGFAALAAYKAVGGGACLENFNLQRFEAVLMEKSEGNPWILSENLIIYSLFNNIFNSNYIKKAENRSFTIPLPDDYKNRKWLYLNPLDTRSIRVFEGNLVIDSIPERNIIAVSEEGGKSIDILISSSGWCAVFESGLSGKSGSW